jgi:dihydrofolate reductase
MLISIIAAMTPDRVIGIDQRLPWHLSTDLKRFRRLTMGKPIVMGRKTFESIGRPLPGRTNIILTGQRDFVAPGCHVVHSIEQALDVAQGCEEVMVIGGASVYAALLPHARRLYLTIVEGAFPGDTYFPQYPADEWQEKACQRFLADKRNPYPYRFVILERREWGNHLAPCFP